MSNLIEVEAFITHVLETGSGFAVRTDNGEQIYVPPSITKRCDLDDGIVNLRIFPNPKDDTCEWMALAVLPTLPEPEQGEPAPAPEPTPEPTPEPFVDWEARVAGHLASTGVPLRTGEMAADFGITTCAMKDSASEYTKMVRAVQKLHNRGKISRCAVYARADQKLSSVTYYAANVDVLKDSLESELA